MLKIDKILTKYKNDESLLNTPKLKILLVPSKTQNRKTKINKTHDNTIISRKSNQVQCLKDQTVIYPKQDIKHYISLEFQFDD